MRRRTGWDPRGTAERRAALGRWAARTVAWLLVSAWAVGSVAALRLAVAEGSAIEQDVLIVVASLGLVSVGTLIVHRRPGNVIGWLLAVAGGFGGVITWIDRYVPHAHAGAGEPSTAAVWVTWFGTWSWAPVILPLFFFLPLLFPDGRLPSRRWRPAVWMGVALSSLQILATALRPGPMPWGPEQLLADNPVGVGVLGPYTEAVITASEVAALPVIVLVVFVAPVLRWRRSRDVERQQMKWFVAAVTLLAALVPLAFFELLPHRPLGVVFALALLAVPVAVGIAVLRYRLYEIDRIISRTVSYAVLTVLLVGIYVAGVVGLGAAVRAVTGGGGGDLVVAASTLAVAAAFGPLRRRVQAVVDRRFNRSRYDAQRTVEAFAQRLRDEVDLDALATETARVAARTMHPSSLSLWLRDSESSS